MVSVEKSRKAGRKPNPALPRLTPPVPASAAFSLRNRAAFMRLFIATLLAMTFRPSEASLRSPPVSPMLRSDGESLRTKQSSLQRSQSEPCGRGPQLSAKRIARAARQSAGNELEEARHEHCIHQPCQWRNARDLP